MRFEVPQFIEIEDKIFGPLSWRQFLYLSGGVGMAVVIFFTTNFFVFLLVGLPLGLMGGALAFFPVNNRPFSYFLEALINYLKGNRLYYWRQRNDIVYRAKASEPAAVVKPATLSRKEKKRDIASLSRKLELQALQKTE